MFHSKEESICLASLMSIRVYVVLYYIETCFHVSVHLTFATVFIYREYISHFKDGKNEALEP